MALLRCVQPSDAGEIATKLIQEFETLDRILAASPETLVRIAEATPEVGTLLAAVRRATLHVLQHRVASGPIVSTSDALRNYLQVAMGGAGLESVRALFLDAKNRLLRDEEIARGSVAETKLHPRLMIKRALELDAAGLILVHNHPSGDSAPSNADIQWTRSISHAAAILDIAVHDHLIVARDGITSLRSSGLI